MTRLLSSLFLLAALVSAQAPQIIDTSTAPSKSKARLEGQVVNAATGEPIRKARLGLRMTAPAAGTTPGPDGLASYIDASDAQGKFLFEDIEPGKYQLTASRTGFVSQRYGARSSNNGGTTLTLESGQSMKDLVFKLTPQGLISGRVLDEDGDPVPGVWAMSERLAFVRGRRQLQSGSGAIVQDDGSFTIVQLAAGRYYLSVTDNRGYTRSGPPDLPGRKGPEHGYATTYFPNAQDFSSAAPIDVAAGQEIRGIEIRVRTVGLFRIRGKLVSNAAGDALANQYLSLVPKDDLRMFAQRFTTSTRNREGAFEFARVPAGTYTLESQFAANRPAVRYQVTVGDHNLEGLAVPLMPPLEISGVIRTETTETNNARPAPPVKTFSALTVGVSPTEGPLISIGAEMGDEGSFQLSGIPPDKFRVWINSLPEGTYLKSIRFGGEDITQADLDLTAGAGGALEIVLSPKGADISGVVRNESGEAVPGVMVSLWNPSSHAGIYQLPKSANTDQNGAFKLRNLAPGEYRLAAWEDVATGLLENLDFRQQFDTQASTVKVGESAHENADLKLIVKSVIDAEVAKLK